MHIHQLQNSIDELVDLIARKISEHEIEGLDDLLMRRHSLLTELISLHQVDADKKLLLDYLAALREKDYKLIKQLAEIKDSVKDSLLKISKIKEYVK